MIVKHWLLILGGMKNIASALLLMNLLAFSLVAIPLTPVRAAEEAAEPGPGKDDKKGPKDVTGGKFAGDPIYVHISPMILPVINENGVEQLVTIIIDVEVKDFDAADQMHSHMPRVMDALMRKLYGGLGTGVLKNGKLADVSKVKSKALDAVAEVIGAENVREILVQSISQRML